MPGKSRPVVCRIVIAEIIQQQKGIKILRFAETEGTLQLHTGAFYGRLRLNNLFNWAE
jgi:hypothetical protein